MENITNIASIKSFLPFLIPLVCVQLGLLIYVIWHILTHENYKRGTRAMWLVITIVLMNFVGPILYLVLGKEEE